MTTLHTIRVTQRDIYDGARQNPLKCPITLAAQRTFPTSKNISWGVGQGCMCTPKFRVLIPVDWHIPAYFVRDFDEGKAVKPFSFEVTVDA